MKIVVLAGGISTERDVSLSSGTGIYKALKEKGHQAILIDVFLGYPGELTGDLFALEKDWAADMRGVSEEITDIAQIIAQRPDYKKNFFGPNVITLCQQVNLSGCTQNAANCQNHFQSYGRPYHWNNDLCKFRNPAYTVESCRFQNILRESCKGAAPNDQVSGEA